MRQASTLLVLGALSSYAAAWRSSSNEESWTPAQETPVAQGNQDQLAIGGVTPRPTRAPQLLGRMQLLPRLDGYSLAPGTCGFVESDGSPYTCRDSTAICSRSGGWENCCEPNKECTVMKTTCIDYKAVQSGACNLPDDYHTLCCMSSDLPACFTWYISTTATDGGDDETFTALGCRPTAGSGILLDYDPAWSKTHKFTASATTKSDEASSTTATSSEAATSTGSNNGGGGGGGGSNTGAIAGGAVGGVAAIALIGLAAFFLIRRNKNKKAATPALAAPNTTQSPPPNMAQMNTTPSQGFSPTSPGGAMYPSGVPPNYNQGGYPPQGYDPHMSYQQGQFPPQQGYNQYSPQPYPPQQGFEQQQGYNAGGYAPTSTASPPPHMSPSPVKEGETAPPAQQEFPAQELPATNPVGHNTNRAELG